MLDAKAKALIVLAVGAAARCDPDSPLGGQPSARGGSPTTLIYDAKGSLVDAHFGVLDPVVLATRVQALRANLRHLARLDTSPPP